MSDFDRPSASQVARHGWATILVVAGVIIALILVATMWVFGWGFFSRATADFRGETGVIERVHADPDYRIANYDWFFNQCAAVQNQEGLIVQLEAELTDDLTASRESQIKATLTAVRSNRTTLINNYNSRANREDTAANFLASNLPDQLDPNEEETTCTPKLED
jgi:predicted Zn-dependent peptidase